MIQVGVSPVVEPSAALHSSPASPCASTSEGINIQTMKGDNEDHRILAEPSYLVERVVGGRDVGGQEIVVQEGGMPQGDRF